MLRMTMLPSEITASPDAADDVVAAYRRTIVRRSMIVAGLAVACVLAFLLDIATGPSSLRLGDVLRGLLAPETLSASQTVIVWQVRMPYGMMALLVGASLSVAGAEMQTILNNPLASPFTLGVSSAASLGASLAIVLGVTIPFFPKDWTVSLNAFLCAFGSVLLLQLMSRNRGTGSQTIVLFGVALVFVFNAMVALVQFVSTQEALQQLVFWSMGSLTRANWHNVGILAVVVAVLLPFSLQAAWKMTALRLGDDRARSFGINVARLRFLSLLRISILAATSVAFVGTIGFIGLVGPHIARLLIGEDHRFLLPASALTGALIMSLASVASKTIVPGVVVPVGIVTAIIGVPVFLLLIYSRKDGS